MSVLVTGGAGYIGSHMVLALRDRGESVVGSVEGGVEAARTIDGAMMAPDDMLKPALR